MTDRTIILASHGYALIAFAGGVAVGDAWPYALMAWGLVSAVSVGLHKWGGT